MLSHASRRILVVAVLLSALLLPAVPVQALPLGFDPTPGLAPVAGLLERLWAYLQGLAGLNKEGVSIDPDGHHVTPPPTTGAGVPGSAVTLDGGSATSGTTTVNG